MSGLNFAQVGIGILTPDASSVLDLHISDKGLLIPRMTTAQNGSSRLIELI